jgi:VIT1/CCC1 family predicted Fe2+/Mn2+ transporter
MHPISENHLVNRVGWLRAAVLGANDGLISTSSLMVGVAAAATDTRQILLAGIAGLAAGSMAMAAGEYVSVSSQADAEAADEARERQELADNPAGELDELTQIYVSRGVSPDLARQVAEQMTAKDALGAHLRDELGVFEHTIARPAQAAVASALTFALGAALPILAAVAAPVSTLSWTVTGATVAGLAILGAVGAHLGAPSAGHGARRVLGRRRNGGDGGSRQARRPRGLEYGQHQPRGCFGHGLF